MRSQIKQWLPVLPLFSNPVDRQQAPAVRIFFLSIILAAIVWMLGITLFIPRSTALLSTHVAALMIIGAHWLALRLLRRSRFDLAVMISALSLLLAGLTVITIWGPHSAAGMVPALTVSLLLVGLLGSRRNLILTASLSMVGVLLLTVAEARGLRIPGRTPVEVNPLLITGSVFVLSTGVMLILLLQFGHTLRQALQAALVRQQELEHTRRVLTDRTIELGRALTERQKLEAQLIAAQKLESLGTLAGGIAHDFNNLLTVILGSADVAIATMAPDDPAQADLQAVVHAATRASTLTRQLLGFARKQPLLVETIDLNQLISRMQTLLARTLGQTRYLMLNLDPALRPVRADAGQLEQVLINLVINARDALQDGGALTLQTRRVAISSEGNGDCADIPAGIYTMLTVHDTGVGMDAATCARAFEPFFTTKPAGSGTGLGMAMCYGIVQQHGGHIRLDSTVGVGTTVRIYLPEAPDALGDPTAAAAPSQAAGDEVVLVADDEPALRRLVVRVLRKYGYQVIEATNGQEAIQLAEQWDGPPISLLITDVVMTPLRGTELARQLWQRNPTLRVIFMSGYTEETPLPDAVSEQHTRFLAKPFDLQELAQLARALLDAAGAGKR